MKNTLRSRKVSNTLTLKYWRDGDWYVGHLIEIPGVSSQGKTLEDLQDNIRDAYELVLQYLKDNTAVTRHRRSHMKSIEVPVLA